MSSAWPIALVVAVVAAGCGSTKTVTETKTVTAPATTKTGLGPPGENVQFGHIESLTRKGNHFELRFDPAWFLSAETANTAAAEDQAVDPGQPVPNDNYVVEEGHRLLTYLVPDNAPRAPGDGRLDQGPRGRRPRDRPAIPAVGR